MSTKDMSRVKLPAFISNSPQTWWLTCESIFLTNKIKNRTEKYKHLVAALPADVRSKLLYILAHPVEEAPNADPHLNMLKGALFQCYSPTNYEYFKAFVSMKPLQPGQKPSVLCNSLQASLPAHVSIQDHNYFSL